MEADLASILVLLENLSPVIENHLPLIFQAIQTIGYFLTGMLSALIFAVAWRA